MSIFLNNVCESFLCNYDLSDNLLNDILNLFSNFDSFLADNLNLRGINFICHGNDNSLGCGLWWFSNNNCWLDCVFWGFSYRRNHFTFLFDSFFFNNLLNYILNNWSLSNDFYIISDCYLRASHWINFNFSCTFFSPNFLNFSGLIFLDIYNGDLLSCWIFDSCNSGLYISFINNLHNKGINSCILFNSDTLNLDIVGSEAFMLSDLFLDGGWISCFLKFINCDLCD